MTRGAVDSGDRRVWWVRIEARTDGWTVIMVGGRLSSGQFEGWVGIWQGKSRLVVDATHDGEDEEEGRLRWIAEEDGSSDILTRGVSQDGMVLHKDISFSRTYLTYLTIIVFLVDLKLSAWNIVLRDDLAVS